MKIFRFGLGVWLLALGPLSAQVTVELQPEQEQFLPGEPVNIAARVTNLSGQSMKLGAENEWLQFSVESRAGFIVSELQKPAVTGEFTLDSSKTAKKLVDLAPAFDLSRPGRYTVTATVHVPGWNQEFTSNPKGFDVIQGAKLWQREFGVPGRAEIAGGVPEVRRYTLQQANYLRRLKLYLRITDAADSKIIKVFSLGEMISFSQPEPQVDKASNLHVLWQTGARSFAYRMVSPDGEIMVRQTYDYAGNRPRLQTDGEGKIVVGGGARRITREDVPAPAGTSSTSAPDVIRAPVLPKP